jgi:hypothetical protein
LITLILRGEGALIGVAPVIRKANFASMSVGELWEVCEEISKLLEAKMLAEKKLELRLNSLHPAKIVLSAGCS